MADFPDKRIVAGTMTGTSIDGLDVAFMELTGRGLELRARLLHHGQTSLGDLATPLRALAEQVPMTAGDIARLAHDFGRLHAEAISTGLEAGGIEAGALDLVVVHGQTVFHAPPLSWALIDTSPLLERFDCPILSDLRMNDLARGGEGAPITPLADWVLFRDEAPTSIVNLGGFCNATHLPAAKDGPTGITGGDVCACNHLLDALARRTLDAPFDRDGLAARSGRIDEALSERLSVRFGPDPAIGRVRSLGTGDEMTDLLDQLDVLNRSEDRLATLVDAVGRTIAAHLPDSRQVLFFGGGTRNRALRDALERHGASEAPVFEHPAIPVEAREATAMGILGGLAADGVPITLSAVTGRSPRPGHRDGRWSLSPDRNFTDS